MPSREAFTQRERRAIIKHFEQGWESPDIAPLFDAYRQFYKAASNLEGSRQFILARLTNNESVVFLAMEGEQALGFTQLYPLFASVALLFWYILRILILLNGRD